MIVAGRRAMSACTKRTAGLAGAARHRISTRRQRAGRVGALRRRCAGGQGYQGYQRRGRSRSHEDKRGHMRPSKRRARTLTADESRRASTTCRARCVDEAPEAKNVEDSSVVGRADPRGQARAHAAQAGAAQGPSPRTSHGARQQRVERVAWTRRRRPGTPRTAASKAELTPPEGRRNRTGGQGRARQTQ